MKFTCSVDINLGRDDVITLFDNPDNMGYWQDDFISFTPKDGQPGKEGSTAIVKYKRVELLETIIKNNLPEQFYGSYEGNWGKNTMNNYFKEIGHDQTRWDADVEFTEFNGFMMKVMKILFPKTFQKQTQKWMDQFKVFAESKVSN